MRFLWELPVYVKINGQAFTNYNGSGGDLCYKIGQFAPEFPHFTINRRTLDGIDRPIFTEFHYKEAVTHNRQDLGTLVLYFINQQWQINGKTYDFKFNFDFKAARQELKDYWNTFEGNGDNQDPMDPGYVNRKRFYDLCLEFWHAAHTWPSPPPPATVVQSSETKEAGKVWIVRGAITKVKNVKTQTFTDLYTQTITITNNTGSVLWGPLALVLDSLGTFMNPVKWVEIVEPTMGPITLAPVKDKTLSAPPAGRPYVNIIGTDPSLAPDAKATAKLYFQVKNMPKKFELPFVTAILGRGPR